MELYIQTPFLISFTLISPLVSSYLSLSFHFHSILISHLHMSKGMKLKRLCWALSGERGNVILQAKHIVFHLDTTDTQGYHNLHMWSKKWLTPNLIKSMECKANINTRTRMLKGKNKSQYAIIRSKFAQLIPLSLYGSQVCTDVKRLSHEICFSNRSKLIQTCRNLSDIQKPFNHFDRELQGLSLVEPLS